MIRKRPLYERIDEKIDRTATCWLWLGAKDLGGYPLVWVNASVRAGRVHRIMFERFVGQIPAGLTLDHLCRVRHCVNPAHLEPCTAGENARRSPNAPYWKRAAQTHCKRGHAFTEQNTSKHNGRRECRECTAMRMREYRKDSASHEVRR